MSARDPFPAVEDLVPHRGPSLMIQRVLEAGGGELRAAGRIPFESAFAAAGGAPCYVGLDLLAQAAGALDGLGRGATVSAGGPGIGYLVSIRKARFDVRHLPLDRELNVRVRLRAGAGPMAEYEAELAEGDEACLAAALSTFRRSATDR